MKFMMIFEHYLMDILLIYLYVILLINKFFCFQEILELDILDF